MILLLLFFMFGCTPKPQDDSEAKVPVVEIERVSPALRECKCSTDNATYSINSPGPSIGPEVENALADYNPDLVSKKLAVEYAKREAEKEARQKKENDAFRNYNREHISHEDYKRSFIHES